MATQAQYRRLGESNKVGNYSELTLKGFIDEMYNASSGPHPRKFCFVLGAGASRSSGIKSGQELVDIWDRELSELTPTPTAHREWKECLKITDENKYSFYSHYYEERFKRHPVDGYNFLEKLMEDAKPGPGHVMLANFLSRSAHNVVITTNFDHLVEDSVSYYMEKMPRVIGHESLARYVTQTPVCPTVLKIHRDLLFNPANRVKDVDTLKSSWKKVLNAIFSQYHPVFIGYAGNDNSLMNYLVENNARFRSRKLCTPYWMLHKGDKVDGKIHKFLEGSSGIFVRHDGFDTVLVRLGQRFGYKPPTKDDLVQIAEERFRALDEITQSFAGQVLDNYSPLPFGKPYKAQQKTPPDGTKMELGKALQQIAGQSETNKLYLGALALHNAQKYDEALVLKQQLVEIEPNNARYLDSLSDTLYEMERYEDALVPVQKAVKLEPDDASYQNSLGVTLHEMDRYEDALVPAQKAVELEPGNARYQNSLSDTLRAMKRYEDALISVQKAVQLEPDNALYQNNLGVTLRGMGRYDEAFDAHKRLWNWGRLMQSVR